MKRVLLWIGGALLVLLAALLLTGLALPREHRARSCLTLAQPAESLWAAARDIGGTPRWWPQMTSAERVDSAGQERWRELVDDFAMTVRLEDTLPGERFHTVIEAAPDAVFGGRWVYAISPSAAGHTLCITEEGWVGNPLFRAIGTLMGQHASLDSYLTALAARFGSTAVPEHLD